MSIENKILSMCVQNCVYWGNPVNDGFGAYTFDDPIEIKCHWQDKEQIIGRDDEKIVTSRAIVFVTQDVVTEGLLWLGALKDLTITQQASPRTITGITIIKRFEKTPAMKSTTIFMRKAFVSPLLF
jgi:hypothetical protein